MRGYLFGVASLLFAVGYYYYLNLEDLSGKSLSNIPDLKGMNELERERYSGDVEFSFKRSKPVPEIVWDASDDNFIHNLILNQKPYVIKETPVTPQIALFV